MKPTEVALNAGALRRMLERRNEEGVVVEVVGMDSAGTPFLAGLTGPYAEGDFALVGLPWDAEVGYDGFICEECAAQHGAARPIETLEYPVTILRGEGEPVSVYDEVEAERARAHAKHGLQSMENAGWWSFRRLSILLEEVGEVAQELNDVPMLEQPDPARLRAELIQVAAMATAWADAITEPARDSIRRPVELSTAEHQDQGDVDQAAGS